jgi:lipopolysaccharide biosynthesis glycosyltransferase
MRIITGSNEAGMEMTKNLLTSLKKVGIPLSEVDLYVFKREPEKVDYGTDGFKKLTKQKLEVMLDALTKYEEVLWIDTDIVAVHDFREDLEIRGALDEMATQDALAGNGFCSGFMYMHRSQSIIDVLTRAIRLMNVKDIDDEGSLNTVIIPSGVKAIKLPYFLYPNGKVYFDYKIQLDALIVHNNYIVGFENKKKRFQETLLWYINDDVIKEVNTINDWKEV